MTSIRVPALVLLAQLVSLPLHAQTSTPPGVGIGSVPGSTVTPPSNFPGSGAPGTVVPGAVNPAGTPTPFVGTPGINTGLLNPSDPLNASQQGTGINSPSPTGTNTDLSNSLGQTTIPGATCAGAECPTFPPAVPSPDPLSRQQAGQQGSFSTERNNFDANTSDSTFNNSSGSSDNSSTNNLGPGGNQQQ